MGKGRSQNSESDYFEGQVPVLEDHTQVGIEVPKDVTQALAIDSKTGTDFWRKAIEKEMLNVTPAF